MKDYNVDDTYLAAAIVCEPDGQWPDKFFVTHGERITVNMQWNELADEIVDKIRTKSLRVEPVGFGKIHRQLKNKVLEIKGGYTDVKS